MSAVEIAAVLVDRLAGRSGFRNLDDPARAVTDRRLFDLSIAKCPPSAEAASVHTPSNSHIVAAFKAVSRGASLAVLLGGFLVLIGWIFDIQILTTPCPEWVTVKANTALAFVLAGMTLRLLQGELDGRWTQRIAHAGAAPTTLTADPVRFKQILYNLLSNAIKFTPEDGQVTVTARAVRSAERKMRCATFRPSDNSDAVEIAVADTGIGRRQRICPSSFSASPN